MSLYNTNVYIYVDKQMLRMLFSLQIDNVIAGKYPKRDSVVVLNRIPDVLHNIGLPDLPITITQKHIYTIVNDYGKYKNVNYHGLGEDLIKQLPNCIKKPLYVFKSQTKSDSIVVVTSLRDKQNRPIIVSIKISGSCRIKNIRIGANVLTGAYGRNNYNDFIKNNILLDKLLYDYKNGIIKKLDTTDRKQ